MYALARLDALIEERLGGDSSRFLELFENREVFDLLRTSGLPGDWYHFEPKTFDGDYLVEASDGFHVYWQERGMKTAERQFDSLKEAAKALFSMRR